MNASIKRVIHFPISKIIVGIVVCFSPFVVIQNLVLKPFFYSIQKKSFAYPIIIFVCSVLLLVSYYYLFRLYDKRRITELSLKYFPKEMFGSFIFGFFTISKTPAANKRFGKRRAENSNLFFCDNFPFFSSNQ